MFRSCSGLVATGLVLGGAGTEDATAKDVLKALQAASICCGLPFTFMLCFMMPAIWYGLKEEDSDRKKKHFRVPVYGGIFDCMEWFFSFGACAFPALACWCDTCLVRAVFMIHVGGTRCVTSSTDQIMTIQAWITWTVECIRPCTLIFFFYG